MNRIATMMLLSCLIYGSAQARAWKDANGKVIEVAQWTVEGDKVMFVTNGRKVPYEINKLSKEDQDFLQQQAKPADVKVQRASGMKGKPPVTLPNGDVVVKDLPEPLVDAVVSEWRPLAAIAVLDAYYGWKLPILELAKKNKYDSALDHWLYEDAFYRDVGKESRTKVSFTKVFEFDTLVKQINAGQPMIHWRGWSEAREAKYVEFEKQLFTDPTAELPSHRDTKEKRNWIVHTGGSDAITAMLIGYNKKRGEVLMYSPYYGADYKCFRMRKEEMEVTGYGFFTFEPK